jgi:hypothetical protein
MAKPGSVTTSEVETIRGCHMVDIGHTSCFFNSIFCFLVFFRWKNCILFWYINLNFCGSYFFFRVSNLVLD